MEIDFFSLVGGVVGGAAAFLVLFFVVAAVLALVLRTLVSVGSKVPVWLGVRRARSPQQLPLEALNTSPQIL